MDDSVPSVNNYESVFDNMRVKRFTLTFAGIQYYFVII